MVAGKSVSRLNDGAKQLVRSRKLEDVFENRRCCDRSPEGDEFLGVLGVYPAQPRDPDVHERQLLERTRDLLAVAATGANASCIFIPAPGVRGSAALAALAAPQPGRIQYAHADLAAYSVFEEAYTLGFGAGQTVAARLRGG